MGIIFRTQRLILREMTPADLPALCRILQDAAVMTPVYGAPFTDAEARTWLDRHLERYRTLGYGLWAVTLKETGKMIGQCGLTLQPWRDAQVLEVGYLFARAFQGQGYASEAARACVEYAFTALDAPAVHAIIPDFNEASRRVAVRCGMQIADAASKPFRGREMNFILYKAVR